jgi:capsular exopolysaccharide synthesis family protein
VELKDLIPLARRRWKTIASMLGAALIIAAALTFTMTPTYHSTARVFISTNVATSNEAFLASAFGQARVTSYADLATSGEVMEKVIDRLDLNLTPSELADRISADVAEGTVIINLDAQDPDPRIAQQIAQTEAEVLTAYLAELETPSGKTVTPIKATITDRASFDGDPVSPKTLLNFAIAAVLGLLLGCVLAVLRDLLDTTVKSPNDIAAATSAPVMAHVAFDPNMPKQPLVTDTGSHSPRFEAFRVLRTNLQFVDLDKRPSSFVITSALPGEGKTSTAINLSIALAQAGKRVLLVDGDLRRSALAKTLSLESAVGLTTVLVGRSDLASSIQHHSSGVDVLAAGPIPPNPTEILQSRATKDLIANLDAAYDVVVIDAPPLLPVADAAVLATHVDGAIMVVRYGRTTRDQLHHATNRLEQVGARLFGITMNMTPRRRIGESDYSYGYGYYGYYDANQLASK